MNPHQFYTINTQHHRRTLYFTGSFRKRRFPLLCRLFRLREIVPDFSPDYHKAEFHLSPLETTDSLNALRAQFPEYRLFSSPIALDHFTNQAMLPRFLIIIKRKGAKTWRYYVSGSSSDHLTFSPILDDAHFMNLDDIKLTCEEIHINHKDFSYQAIPTPNRSVHADSLASYLEKNPPQPIYLTFHLNNEK